VIIVDEMPDELDPAALTERFRSRAAAVRSRGVPPIEGPERRRFIEQAQVDYMDFAMIGDAQAMLVDGILTLRIDLRPENPLQDSVEENRRDQPP
jgi:hypothetical protein